MGSKIVEILVDGKCIFRGELRAHAIEKQRNGDLHDVMIQAKLTESSNPPVADGLMDGPKAAEVAQAPKEKKGKSKNV